MNTQKNVNQRLAKLYTKQVAEKQELSSEKVELALVDDAAKALNDFVQLRKKDNKLRGQESKIEKAYLNYKQSQKEWINALSDVESDANKLEDDLVKILDAAQEIGVDGRQIDGFAAAADLVGTLQNITRDGKNLYPPVK